MGKIKGIDKYKVRLLLSQGLTKKEVAKLMNTTYSTIYYHAIDKAAKKHFKVKQKYRNDQRPLIHKIDAFHKQHKSLGAANGNGYNFTVNQLEEKIGKNNPLCYLSGRPIDLTDSSSYQLDHMQPRSRGGENTLENCGAACAEANKSKSAMTGDEYLILCKDVLEYNGYYVTLK